MLVGLHRMASKGAESTDQPVKGRLKGEDFLGNRGGDSGENWTWARARAFRGSLDVPEGSWWEMQV